MITLIVIFTVAVVLAIVLLFRGGKREQLAPRVREPWRFRRIRTMPKHNCTWCWGRGRVRVWEPGMAGYAEVTCWCVKPRMVPWYRKGVR